MNKIKKIISVCLVTVSFYACIPAKQFEDLQTKDKNCQDENSRLKDDNQLLKTENNELKESSAEMNKNVSRLKQDTSEMGTAYQRLNNLYNELTISYDKLLSNDEKLLAGNTEETKKLILDLNKAKEDLQLREDQMKKDSAMLGDREIKLNKLKEDLNAKQARVDELESVLKSVDSSVNSLKSSVSNALLGYENNGLTVVRKDGRVYVSMDEQLLFTSGSTVVEKKGESALKELAHVLATNKNINITVEGHTDNVPITGTLPSGAKDNWELSVLRATSVVEIILKNDKIDPIRITASGRGPFLPLDASGTTEARKKNRRTEIILSPKLDDLAKILKQLNN